MTGTGWPKLEEAAQTLGASKKPRRLFPTPRYVARR